MDLYHLLTALVIPRPIAWVSTVGPDGIRNIAPHSFFNLISRQPPYLAFSSAGVKDTLRNVRSSREFVVSIVSTDLAELMNATSADAPADIDEFEAFGIEAAPAETVRAPRVAAAKAHLECRVAAELAFGDGNLVVGQILHVHVDPSIWAGGRVQPDLLDPLCRLAGSRYAPLGESFRIMRPRWSDIEDKEVRDRVPPRLTREWAP